ncbi:MAG: ParB/RepB/Spo0J family partition protein [Candidatus Methanospirareceae archaeon]
MSDVTRDTSELKIMYIKRDKIRKPPIDTRFRRLKGYIRKLAEDIEIHGLKYPILVRELEDGTYEIIDGGYRFLAYEVMNEQFVPCIVVRMDEDEAILEGMKLNIMRKQYNALDIAQAYLKLHEEYGIDKQEFCERLGISRMTLYRALQIYNNATDEEKEQYLKGELSLRELYRRVRSRLEGQKSEIICPICGKEIVNLDESKLIRVHTECYENWLSERKVKEYEKAKQLSNTCYRNDS